MSAEQRVTYEARMRPRAAGLAVVAAVLLLVASIIQVTGPHTKVDELTLDLITANKRYPVDVIASVINGLGSLALAITLVFLFDSARARNPQYQPGLRIVAMLGGSVAAVAGVAYQALVAAKSHDFVTTGNQTYQEAHHLTNSSGILALQLIGQAAALLLALSFVLVSLNAMRVGLLTRFMGYLGIFAGVLVLFQITQVPVVQAYWLFALAYLLLGRWPTGVPPAWSSGRAEPWPSGQQIRQQRGRAAGRGAGRGSKPAPAPAPEPVGAQASRTRSTTPKRKRKRRR